MANPKILIVDDDADLRQAVIAMLKTGGIVSENVQAGGGDEAIDKLKQEEFDLVVLDKQMPKVDGFEVLDFITEHCPKTVVIMLTQVNEPYLISLIELKGAFYVPKPPVDKAFVLLVKRELGRQRGFQF